MLLFIFVIMLVNLDQAAKERQFNRHWLAGLVAVAAVGAQVAYFIHRGSDSFHFAAPLVAGTPAGLGNTEQIADSLFGEYLLPFEVASLLLLVADFGNVPAQESEPAARGGARRTRDDSKEGRRRGARRRGLYLDGVWEPVWRPVESRRGDRGHLADGSG